MNKDFGAMENLSGRRSAQRAGISVATDGGRGSNGGCPGGSYLNTLIVFQIMFTNHGLTLATKIAAPGAASFLN